jgi:hypothetical protein
LRRLEEDFSASYIEPDSASNIDLFSRESKPDRMKEAQSFSESIPNEKVERETTTTVSNSMVFDSNQ